MRFVLISLHIVLSLFIFQSGFLLKRQELLARSRCQDAHSSGTICWFPRQYARVILIVVDALRHDFLQPKRDGQSSEHFRGQMRNSVRAVANGDAAVGTVLADPPTTTLQRIKALTTGTLPTFIDAGDNFSPDAVVNEDNLISQANAQGINVTLLGDSTWATLYPNKFARVVAFDSFDIHDLNSIDDAIRPVLVDEVNKSSSRLIIAHFLGVDHCGHKFGPKHPMMSVVLKKMDDVIGETMTNMHDDDLLVVIGDHGMTSTGDHGGDSNDETHAGIMVATKREKLTLPAHPIRQIDVVPTIAMLLGLPVPFSNLGTVIQELFAPRHRQQVVALNYEQIKRFAETYAAQNGLNELYEITARETSETEEQLRVMSRVQTTLRTAWTQFDFSYIAVGILCLVEGILFLFSGKEMSTASAIFRLGCVFLQLALLFDHTESNPAHPILTIAMSLSCCSFLVSIAANVLHTSAKLSSTSSLTVAAVVLHAVSFFSNSYVVYEAQTLKFLLQSIFLVLLAERVWWNLDYRNKNWQQSLVRNLKSTEGSLLLLGMIVVRLEPYFHRCREEEVDCVQYYPTSLLSALSIDAQLLRVFLSAVSIFAANYAVHYFTPSFSNSMRLVKAFSWLVHLCIVLFSLINVQMVHASEQSAGRLVVFLPQFVYLASFVSVVVAVAQNTSGYFFAAYSSLWPMYILVGDGIQPAVVLFGLLVVVTTLAVPSERIPALVSLLVPFGFYLTGHSPCIPSIPWTAAFVGVPGAWELRVLPAMLVLSHVCASALVGPVVLLLRATGGVGGDDATTLAASRTVALSALRCLFSCLAAFVLRRHLMVWKIFAPRFIFESLHLVALLISLNIVLIATRRLCKQQTV